MYPPERRAAISPTAGPAGVSLMSPLAAPLRIPRARIPAANTSSACRSSSGSSSLGMVCPISTKYGGKKMWRSATPQTVAWPR